MKNKKILYLINTLAFLIGTTILIINLTNKKDKKTETINNNLNINNNLWADYQNKKITIDEYVKNMLYQDYDIELLNDKYKPSSNTNNIEIDNFITKNLDKLSDSTKEYYLRKNNLENITFELDKENNESKKTYP